MKKTTNWNISDGDQIRRILSADPEENLDDEVKDRLRDRHGGFNPAEAYYKRYYVDEKMTDVLIDFEEYSLRARKGGTDSILRKSGNKDEDIRQMIVQEVSSFQHLTLFVVFQPNRFAALEESICRANQLHFDKS